MKLKGLEKSFDELKNSTLEVMKCTGKVPKLNILKLSKYEKEIFYNEAMKRLS